MSYNDFDLINYLNCHIRWSRNTFGEGKRTEGILRHIASESDEVRQAPEDLEEWIDILILAFDGAWRSGHSPNQIYKMLELKQEKNFARTYPKPVSDDEPSFHVKQ